jgi:heme exporter protein D
MIQFSSIQEFIAMGGYAFNVWSVYGLFVIFLAANLIIPLRRKKQLLKELKRRRAVTEQAVDDAPQAEVRLPSLDESATTLGEST